MIYRTKNVLGLILLLISLSTINAQSPGGVANGLELWLRADIGAGSSLWSDVSGNNRHFSGINSSLPTSLMNYNPVYSFTGKPKNTYWKRNSFVLNPVSYPQLNIFHVSLVKVNFPQAPWGMDNSAGGGDRFFKQN